MIDKFLGTKQETEEGDYLIVCHVSKMGIVTEQLKDLGLYKPKDKTCDLVKMFYFHGDDGIEKAAISVKVPAELID